MSFFPLHTCSVVAAPSAPRPRAQSRIASYHIASLLHNRTLRIPLLRLPRLLPLLDLRDHALESFADVLVVARARFREAAAQLFGEFPAVGERDLALLGAQV